MGEDGEDAKNPQFFCSTSIFLSFTTSYYLFSLLSCKNDNKENRGRIGRIGRIFWKFV